MKKINKKSIIGRSLVLLISLYVINACKSEPIIWEPKSDQMVISKIISSGEDSLNFTEFNTLLENTLLDGFLAIRGPYTLFLPNNDAMKAYYASKGINSINDLDIETQKKLVYNHLILAEISSGDIGLGAIREVNALGDKLATEFAGSDILINKTAIVVDRDIKASNGVIHEIDHVIEPISIDIFELVSSDPQFSLFSKGLELTGIKDTLTTVEFAYSGKMARTYFTLLAVPNDVFAKYGITTIDQMINYFTDEPNKITDVNNGFYQFIEYHCLTGSYFLSDFESQLYPILSFNNNVLLTVDDDYKLNNDSETDAYTHFRIEDSNVPAKNGALHVIDDLLPVIDPEPTEIIFDTCEQFEMMQGDYYMKYYQKWYDGQNTFKNIKWEGDYLQYYYKDHGTIVQNNFDGLQMIGYWWLEVTTPKIMKGKYEITGHVWGGRVCDVYVDGVKTTHIGSSDENRVPWGTFEWDTTIEHKIKMVSTSYSTIFWDTIELTPVSE